MTKSFISFCFMTLIAKRLFNEGFVRAVALYSRIRGEHGTFQVVRAVKNLPAGAGDVETWVQSLENPKDRETWWAAVPGVSKSQTRLKQLSMHTRPSDARLHGEVEIISEFPFEWLGNLIPVQGIRDPSLEISALTKTKK